MTPTQHTLLFLEPCHFHAALTLAMAQPKLHRQVHVYARPGGELQSFLSLISIVNRKMQRESAWRVEVHESGDPISRLLNERRGDRVVLANRNNEKLPTMVQLHEAGFHVLADKPWLLSSHDLPALQRVTSSMPIAMDMMTGRHDILTRLLRQVVADPAMFGSFTTDGIAIEMEAIHHLCKLVGDQPLRRPAWYYDVDVQGDGIVDLHSHMIDTAQSLIGDQRAIDADVDLIGAYRYATPVTLDAFRESTAESSFPANLAERIENGRLKLECNGVINYRLGEVAVQQKAEWRERAEPGGGDQYRVVVRGTHCTVTVQNGPDTDYRTEMCVQPVHDGRQTTLRQWVADLPGLSITGDGKTARIVAIDGPAHEHLPDVLKDFIDLVDGHEWPERMATLTRLRYTLLSKARDLALSPREGAPAGNRYI